MSSDALPVGMSSLQVPIMFFMGLNLLSNFSGELLSCDIQTLFATNMYAKHVLGLMLMVFFNILNDPVNAENIGRSILEAFVLYLWFVLLSRTHMYTVFAIAAVLFTIYVLDVRHKRMIKDGVDKDKDKGRAEEADKLVKAMLGLKWAALGMTFLGAVHYMYLKRREYKDGFSVLQFFLGVPECKRN